MVAKSPTPPIMGIHVLLKTPSIMKTIDKGIITQYAAGIGPISRGPTPPSAGSPHFQHLKKELGEELAKVWTSGNFGLDQLELPGDVWNEMFSKNLIVPLAEKAEIPNLKARKNYRPPPVIARKIYEAIENQLNFVFYPEQFDISFDFAPRMCDNKMCNICPFGKNGSSHVCHGNKEKICSVLLVACGYQKQCTPEDCPIIQGHGEGLCRGSQK